MDVKEETKKIITAIDLLIGNDEFTTDKIREALGEIIDHTTEYETKLQDQIVDYGDFDYGTHP